MFNARSLYSFHFSTVGPLSFFCPINSSSLLDLSLQLNLPTIYLTSIEVFIGCFGRKDSGPLYLLRLSSGYSSVSLYRWGPCRLIYLLGPCWYVHKISVFSFGCPPLCSKVLPFLCEVLIYIYTLLLFSWGLESSSWGVRLSELAKTLGPLQHRWWWCSSGRPGFEPG